MHLSTPLLRICGITGLIASGAIAQCTTQWVPGTVPGVLGTVAAATTWDPDGAGPLPPVVVMGGDFTHAGPIAANSIVAFEPAAGTWSTFGNGFESGLVRALAVLPNGELIAAGGFTASGGAPVNRIARWTGAAWAPLGQGLNNVVYALAVLPSGVLIAGGFFTQAGGTPAPAIASWDGTTWSAFPSGLAGAYPGASVGVHSLAVRPNGTLVVGGLFSHAGGQIAPSIAEWNGTAWAPLGGGTVGAVTALAIAANGDVLAGGQFNVMGGSIALGLARWNGSTWSPLGTGPALAVSGIHERANGDVIVGGGMTVGPSGAQRTVRRWNGSAWSDIAGAPPYGQSVNCLAPAPNGDLLVGGDVQFPGGNRGFGLLHPNLTWQPLPLGFASGVFTLHRLPDGELLAGGEFDQAPGVVANRVARFNGVSWSNMGSGLPGTVYALAHLANGDPVAAGTGGGVFRWDGANWTPLGTGMNDQVNDLQLMPNGDLLAASLQAPGVMRWDGFSWSGLPGLNNTVSSLAVLNDGTLAAAGYFAGGGVATWNGTTWNVLGGGAPGATDLAVTANGDLIAAGYMTSAGGVPVSNIARWDGSTWHALGAGISGGIVTAVVATADGGVAATGSFTHAGGVPAGGVARWDGSTWHALDGGLWGSSAPVGYAIAGGPDGEIDVGGFFTGAGGVASANVARWITSCPASSFAYGAGCAGSGGLGVLGVRTPAWVGGTFATRAAGMPALGLAVSATGFAALAIPLASVLPSPPSCMLLATPDLLQLHVPQAGVADVALSLPNSPAIAGLSFRQQVVAIEIGAGGAFTSFTSTNAVLATVGSYQ